MQVGDWGRDGGQNQSAVAALMATVADSMKPDFILSMGDNFYESKAFAHMNPCLCMSMLVAYDHRHRCSLQVPFVFTQYDVTLPICIASATFALSFTTSAICICCCICHLHLPFASAVASASSSTTSATASAQSLLQLSHIASICWQCQHAPAASQPHHSSLTTASHANAFCSIPCLNAQSPSTGLSVLLSLLAWLQQDWLSCPCLDPTGCKRCLYHGMAELMP